jgi:hypothetical protein
MLSPIGTMTIYFPDILLKIKKKTEFKISVVDAEEFLPEFPDQMVQNNF